MIRAEYAGSGKSYACEYMRKLGHKVVFVCPTNLLKQDIGGEAVTLNTFLSVSMPGKDAEPLPKFDDSQFDVIVFDAIFFGDIRMLGRIKRYSESHLEKIILATGDTCQLEAVETLSNTKSFDEYSNHCIDTFFSNSTYLRENKRLKTEEDKQNLKQLKLDIFNKQKIM